MAKWGGGRKLDSSRKREMGLLKWAKDTSLESHHFSESNINKCLSIP